MSERKIKIDLIVIGNPNSGKTSLTKRFIDGQASFSHFYNPTVGLTMEKKIIQIDGTETTICIWDTAGQQKFLSLTKSYFRKADGVMIVFDLTDRESFDRVSSFWLRQIQEKSQQNCPIILVGNKLDLVKERNISKNQIQALANKIGIQYFQTSARTGEKVDESIIHLTKKCLMNVKESEPVGEPIDLRKNNNPSGGCFSSTRKYLSSFFSKQDQ